MTKISNDVRVAVSSKEARILITCNILNNMVFMLTDDNMAAGKENSLHGVGSLTRSKSEGALIDLPDSVSVVDSLKGKP